MPLTQSTSIVQCTQQKDTLENVQGSEMTGRTTRSQTARGEAALTDTDADPTNRLHSHGVTSGTSEGEQGGRRDQPSGLQGDPTRNAMASSTDRISRAEALTSTAAPQLHSNSQEANIAASSAGSKRGPEDELNDDQDPKRQKVGEGEGTQENTSIAPDRDTACENYRNILEGLREHLNAPPGQFEPIVFGNDLELDWVFQANAAVTEAIAENGAPGPTHALFGGPQAIARLGQPMLMPVHQHLRTSTRVRSSQGGHIAMFILRPRRDGENIAYEAEYHDSWRDLGSRYDRARIHEAFIEMTNMIRTWAGNNPAPDIARASQEPVQTRQQGRWQCGIHTILNAWTFALGLQAARPRGRMAGDFYPNAVDIINLARQGLVGSHLIRDFLACHRLIAEDSIVPGNRIFERTMRFGNRGELDERVARVRLEEELNLIRPSREQELPELQVIIQSIEQELPPDRLGQLPASTGHALVALYDEATIEQRELEAAIALSCQTDETQQTSTGESNNHSAVSTTNTRHKNSASSDIVGRSGGSGGVLSNGREGTAEQVVNNSSQAIANAPATNGSSEEPPAASGGPAAITSSGRPIVQPGADGSSGPHGAPPPDDLTTRTLAAMNALRGLPALLAELRESRQEGRREDLLWIELRLREAARSIDLSRASPNAGSGSSASRSDNRGHGLGTAGGSGQRGGPESNQSRGPAVGQVNRPLQDANLPNAASSNGAGASNSRVTGTRSSGQHGRAGLLTYDEVFPREPPEEEVQMYQAEHERLSAPGPIRSRSNSPVARSLFDPPARPTLTDLLRGIRERGDMPDTDEHGARERGNTASYLDTPYPRAWTGLESQRVVAEEGTSEGSDDE